MTFIEGIIQIDFVSLILEIKKCFVLCLIKIINKIVLIKIIWFRVNTCYLNKKAILLKSDNQTRLYIIIKNLWAKLIKMKTKIALP